ncbi:endoplasmic reticulum membrane protein 65 [[Candida] railenensis]|uniref:Endoplasmic reticulum membrane protein 65 n=1 Tax=[Candida] railenensis TaxID=45579 RepID=A0A9P0QKM1_9ASCO|nr:endoplasmic reticulum membrane protein 65 [[Candida] railenensis]
MSRSRTPSKNSGRSRSRSRSQSLPSVEQEKRSRTSSFIAKYVYSPSKQASASQGKDQLFSLYRLLTVELNLPEDKASSSSIKTAIESTSNDINYSVEQISNLVKIPFYLEKFMAFGLLVCLNSFLTLFTLVPLKIVIILYQISKSFIDKRNENRSNSARISTSLRLLSIKREVYTVWLIIFSLCVLSLPYFDISRLYHDVRGSAHIKLYVMFGVLEVADKLFSTIGQDILNILYSVPFDNWNDLPRIVTFGTLGVVYLTCHGYILIYQAVSLNVAANSYSNALLALLLSNQFSELKSSVFKKFEREGLFQIAMADLTERFQLSLMLGVIALRNIAQINSIHSGMIPNSWTSWNKFLGAIVGPSIVVIGSEILVDWLKHCYITKFNKVRPRIYHNFLYVLSLDYLEVFQSNSSSASANSTAGTSGVGLTDYIVLTRRIGLPLLATIVCFLRMTLPDLKSIFFYNSAQSKYAAILISLPLCILGFAALLLSRLILGMAILKWANRIKVKHLEHQELLRLKLSASAVASAKTNAKDTTLNVVPSERLPGLPTEEIKTPVTSETFNIPTHREEEATPPNSFPFPQLANKTSINIDVTPPSHSPMSPTSPKSPIEYNFIPGVPNTESSTINPNTRSYLYDVGEQIPPTPEERRNNQFTKDDTVDNHDEGLGKVMRYEMASKRIW